MAKKSPTEPLDDGESVSPNPEILKKDPMAEVFGPGTGIKMVGDADNDEIPDEVRGVLEEYGLSREAFQCTLKEVPAGADTSSGSSSANSAYVKSWSRSVPSLEYIARNYGPGSYVICFSWRAKPTADEPSKSMREEAHFVISDKYTEEYKAHRLTEKIKQASDAGTKVRDALIEKKLENTMLSAIAGPEQKEEKDDSTRAKEYIANIVDSARMLGLSPIASQTPAKTFDWEKILPVAITGITAYLQFQRDAAQQQQQQFQSMLTLLLSQSNTSNNQLLEVVRAQSGTGSGASQFKEIRDMVLGAIDLKEAIQGGPKETVADKIFKVVEGIAPQILAIAANAAQARAAQNNPMVKFAKGYMSTNPDFIAVQNDPHEYAALIKKLDDFFQPHQTDVILQVVGWQRPGAPQTPPQRADISPEADIVDAVTDN